MSRSPNIVFLMPDQWRPDAVGYAGNPVIQTPNLDALAARGVSFRATHCESPVCQASRASLVTGVYPRDHGLYDNGPNFPSSESFRTFLHRLQDAGYYTAEVGKMHFGYPAQRRRTDVVSLIGADESKNLSAAPRPVRSTQSFLDPDSFLKRHLSLEGDLREQAHWLQRYGFSETHEEADKYLLLRLDSDYTIYLQTKGLLEEWRQDLIEAIKAPGATGGVNAARPEELEPDDTLDAFIGQTACRFIREYSRDEPFFLWVTPIGPHLPYDAPRFWSDRYEPEKIPLGPRTLPRFPSNQWGEFLAATLERFRCKDFIEADWRYIAKLYYGMCSQIDHQVGEIVKAIAQAGIEDETWIFYSSDHGELLGDHGYIQKRLFYRSSVCVPALIVPPKGLDSPIAVQDPIQNIDVVASILDLAGANAEGYHGRSLLGVLEGHYSVREVAFSEITDFTSASTTRYTLVVQRETLEPQALYDRDADPEENTDYLDDPNYGDVVENLLEQYIKPFAAGVR